VQVRLPVVVVGGGLTAIDTATEALAYYPVQVEKFLVRYDALVAERGAAQSNPPGSARSERSRPNSWSTRARFAPRGRTQSGHGREPRIVELLRQWGGATIAYRRRLIDSPSYTLNHEEVEKALEEGSASPKG
jgi:NADPH-dependent glutamate synthase beta subunit-like oxidoreductase